MSEEAEKGKRLRVRNSDRKRRSLLPRSIIRKRSTEKGEVVFLRDVETVGRIDYTPQVNMTSTGRSIKRERKDSADLNPEA